MESVRDKWQGEGGALGSDQGKSRERVRRGAVEVSMGQRGV